ncbi:MAG: hypothetical protein ACPGOU_06825 [Candidatus Nanopelagicales bacterium]
MSSDLKRRAPNNDDGSTDGGSRPDHAEARPRPSSPDQDESDAASATDLNTTAATDFGDDGDDNNFDRRSAGANVGAGDNPGDDSSSSSDDDAAAEPEPVLPPRPPWRPLVRGLNLEPGLEFCCRIRGRRVCYRVDEPADEDVPDTWYVSEVPPPDTSS